MLGHDICKEENVTAANRILKKKIENILIDEE